MKKIHSLILPGALMFVALAESLHAVPAFAKQSGLECFACHSLSQSTLNSVGRKFARSSYMMTKEDGSSSLISGQKMGLGTDTALNASLVLKARLDKGYDVINGKGEVIETQDEEEVGANRGVYEMFKTSTAHLGGKVVSHVGALMELREKEGKAVFGGKVISSMNTDDSSYAGIALYSTDNYGPFSGMENYATGLYKPLRQFENHKLTNAAQAADLGTGSATGLQAFYAGEIIFATIGAYVPLHHNDEIEASSSMIPFARLAFEQKIGDLNFIIGAYGLKGTATAYNTSLDSSLSGLVPRETVEIEKQAYGLDLQIEGDFLTLPSLFTANIVLNNKTTLDKPGLMNYDSWPGPNYEDIYGEPYDSEDSAYSLSYEFYPTPALGLKLAYLHLDDKGPHTYEPDKIDAKDKDAYSVGFDYSLRQNIAFSMEYSWVRPSREDIQDYSDLLAVMTVAF